jgi:hypothetical protein
MAIWQTLEEETKVNNWSLKAHNSISVHPPKNSIFILKKLCSFYIYFLIFISWSENINRKYETLALRLDVPSGSEGLDALLLDDCPLWIRPSGASPSGWTAGRNAGDGDIIDP